MQRRYMKMIFVRPKIYIFTLLLITVMHCELKADLPLVAVITTGGTIAEKRDPVSGGFVPTVSGEDLIKTIPGLDIIARLKVVEFCNIDSSRMTPEIWRDLSMVVEELLQDPEICGAVVTHGTDTMEEGAYFLSVAIQSTKPVVFVGAMR